jgi:carbamoyltransferase
MYILGISAFYHDSAACLILNGEIIAAAQEERFTRIKHDSNFPSDAIKYCVKEAGIDPSEIENVVFYEKPFVKFERLLETYLAFAPRGFKSFALAMPLWIKDKLFQKYKIMKHLSQTLGDNIQWKGKLMFSEHHMSHAASAFFPSPFKKAAILILDGVGEWSTTSVAIGNKNNLKVIKEIHFPHSLGLLYSAFTYYAGFKVNSGEYKMMGLAPYGKPKYVDLIKEKLIIIKNDGSYQLDMTYFDYCTDTKMTSKKFNNLFGAEPRKPESKLTQKEMDLAASIQKITEEILIKLSKNIVKETGEQNLCLAGGVALNCVANGVLLKEKIFKNIWIQPAAGDAGGALGSALAVWHMKYNKKNFKNSKNDLMKGTYLGPSFSNNEIENFLNNYGVVYHKFNIKKLLDVVTKLICEKKAIGWMQGRMEFGPRALGNRSIIADPRSPFMQKQLNMKIKFRESFRPFAPSILVNHVKEWFDLDIDSPYMLFVSNVKKNKQISIQSNQKRLFGIESLNISRSIIPAVTHIDYSARVQTINSDNNPLFYALVDNFYNKTGCPILINTSFNVRGEPIVCSPEDAVKCFMSTELDNLVIGNFLLYKEEQPKSLKLNYVNNYKLD